MANNKLCNCIQLLLLVLLSKFMYLETIKLSSGNVVGCVQIEREALVKMKNSFTDPSGRLSSWVGGDCCRWRGVICNNSTGHVIKLKLHNPFPDNLDGDGTMTSHLGGNLSGMESELEAERYEGNMVLVTKGKEYVYKNILYLVNSIDLSDNNLSGSVPEELSSLSRLGTLNLSINHLSGNIPQTLGNLQRLETLDLSRNQLSGHIPPLIISLTALSHLNLSYNDLSGEIPTSNQFLTFIDPSIYKGNPRLCGAPLTNKCSPDDETSPADNKDDDADAGGIEMFWFYISMGPGFVVGFWVVVGTLIMKSSWRNLYFQFVDRMYNFVSVRLACLRRVS